ncbi:hypothetical protein [Acidipila sp. EB88]|uniref:hypothetical protein n=1 Tax=Acidipila sp. EB88 TaxID=2305226 RepID=UPI000F5FD304|nr:hypothetical protein [Acidipila sp. EB88]RRA49474.1 hypothetical protein D1Y84_15540 [Acidipila sp. EB88]
MSPLRLFALFAIGPALAATACLAGTRRCYAPEDAAAMAGKEICLAAHVYDVVTAEDGTRYLDVCRPGTSMEGCRFTVVSMAADRNDVGPIDGLKEQDVHVRGTVHALRGESIMLLSHARQLHDGPEKFRPNPELISGFAAGSGATAFRDPALSARKHKNTSVFAGYPEH